MKKLVMLLSLMVFTCSSDDNDRENQNNVPQEDTLLGTWELIELKVQVNNSEETEWNSVPESFRYTYIFDDNNIVTRSNYINCEGTYENNPDDYIEITFDCPEYPDYREYFVSFEEHSLILTPPGSCDESGACASKYRKVISN